MIYIDSSSLLKTLWEEPESQAVREAIAGEKQVVVSSLAELETEIQLRAKWLSSACTKGRYDGYRATLASFGEIAPFEFRDLSGAIFRREDTLSFARPAASGRHGRIGDTPTADQRHQASRHCPGAGLRNPLAGNTMSHAN